MSEDKIYVGIEQFLNRIMTTTGDKITEYHWREASMILKEIAELKEQKLIKNNLDLHNVRQALIAFNQKSAEDHCWFLPATDEMIDNYLGNL